MFGGSMEVLTDSEGRYYFDNKPGNKSFIFKKIVMLRAELNNSIFVLFHCRLDTDRSMWKTLWSHSKLLT